MTTKSEMRADIERCIKAVDTLRARPGQWELLEPFDEIREKYGLPDPIPGADQEPCAECQDGTKLDGDIECDECGRVGA